MTIPLPQPRSVGLNRHTSPKAAVPPPPAPKQPRSRRKDKVNQQIPLRRILFGEAAARVHFSDKPEDVPARAPVYIPPSEAEKKQFIEDIWNDQQPRVEDMFVWDPLFGGFCDVPCVVISE